MTADKAIATLLKLKVLEVTSPSLWALVIGAAGYQLGHSLERMLGTNRHIETELFAAIASFGLIVWIVFFWHRRRAGTAGEVAP